MKDRAYAKINLSLDVCKRREDGYHELRSVMLPVNFYDVLEIEKAEKTDYSCDKPYIFWNEHNTIVKMIEAVKEEYGIEDEFSVRLEKSIPVKAGLAGGSADAAAALRILERMYHLDLSAGDIRKLCEKVGSDVLFTYYNRPSLVEGTGNELSFFPLKKKYHVLLVKPSAGISTKESYRTLDLDTCDHPDVYGLREALVNGEDLLPYIGNSLEEPAKRLCPEVEELKRALLEAGAPFSLMSGSGSTVFTMSENEDLIRDIYAGVKKLGTFTRFTRVL